MARKKTVKDYKMPSASSWAAWRQEKGLPPSLQVRERGKCFDCGNDLYVGQCGGWHSRVEYSVVYFCCRCAGHE